MVRSEVCFPVIFFTFPCLTSCFHFPLLPFSFCSFNDLAGVWGGKSRHVFWQNLRNNFLMGIYYLINICVAFLESESEWKKLITFLDILPSMLFKNHSTELLKHLGIQKIIYLQVLLDFFVCFLEGGKRTLVVLCVCTNVCACLCVCEYPYI